MNSIYSIQEGLRNGLSNSKTVKQQLLTLTMCLPACLWARIARTPFDCTVTELGRFLQNVITINFRGWFFSFQHNGNNYRTASMFIKTRAVSKPRDVERRESGSMFCETNHFLKSERIELKVWKHSAKKYHDQAMKFTHPAVGLTSFYSWVCLHHTFAALNLILRCFTGSHMTIFPKSNYRVGLNLNMNIADSISFYFNIEKGHYFVHRVTQHILDKAQFFKINWVNPAIVNWSEKGVETCSLRSLLLG